MPQLKWCEDALFIGLNKINATEIFPLSDNIASFQGGTKSKQGDTTMDQEKQGTTERGIVDEKDIAFQKYQEAQRKKENRYAFFIVGFWVVFILAITGYCWYRSWSEQRIIERKCVVYDRAVKEGRRYDHIGIGIMLQCCIEYEMLHMHISSALSEDEWKTCVDNHLAKVEEWFTKCRKLHQDSIEKLSREGKLSWYNCEKIQDVEWQLEGIGRVLQGYRELYHDFLKAPAGTFPTHVSWTVPSSDDTYIGNVERRLFAIERMRQKHYPTTEIPPSDL